jgi:hypothetical protein
MHVSFPHKLATIYFGCLKIVNDNLKKKKREGKKKENKKRNNKKVLINVSK